MARTRARLVVSKSANGAAKFAVPESGPNAAILPTATTGASLEAARLAPTGDRMRAATIAPTALSPSTTAARIARDGAGNPRVIVGGATGATSGADARETGGNETRGAISGVICSGSSTL
jgi:hypothetical protein